MVIELDFTPKVLVVKRHKTGRRKFSVEVKDNGTESICCKV
jgi:hypothetical protein